MRRTILISALLLGTLAMADQHKYEVSPMIGYNIAEGNLGLKNDGYPLLGAEFQINYQDFFLSPEFSIFTSIPDTSEAGQDISITRLALNGVYTFDNISSFIPFAKIGAGVENVSRETASNKDGFFLDAGAGAKVALSKNWTLKLEAIYMAKLATHNAGNIDSNLMTLVGLTYAFGGVKPKVAPVVPAVVAPVVVVDDDKDGVLNSQDICPNTIVGKTVNSDGCPRAVQLHINFDYKSFRISDDSMPEIDAYVKFLRTYTNYSANIVGYTDDIGSRGYNQRLSQKRANAVKQLLERKGVNPRQLHAEGRGKLNPIAENSTPEGRAANRRIEAELTRN